MIQELKNPENLGKDKLSEFLHYAHKNTFATFTNPNLKPYYERISKVNELFYKVLIAYNSSDIPYLPLFFLQSHSYLLASIRLITACQFTESWPNIRGSIESAIYGYEIYKNPDHWKIYCDRVKGEQQKKACKKIFSAPQIFNKYKKDLAALKILYDESIEKGAHPNIEGLKTKVQNVIINNIPHIQLNLLQGDIEESKNTLILCRNIGLEILKLIFKIFEKKLTKSDFNKLLKEEEKGFI